MLSSPNFHGPSDAQRRANNRTRYTTLLASVSMLTLGLSVSAASTANAGNSTSPTPSSNSQSTAQLLPAASQRQLTGAQTAADEDQDNTQEHDATDKER